MKRSDLAHILRAAQALTKEREYVGAALEADLVRSDTLRERLAEIPGLTPEVLRLASAWIDAQ